MESLQIRLEKLISELYIEQERKNALTLELKEKGVGRELLEKIAAALEGSVASYERELGSEVKKIETEFKEMERQLKEEKREEQRNLDEQQLNEVRKTLGSNE